MYEPQKEIQKKLKRLNIPIRDISVEIDMVYSTLVSQIHGYTKMPDDTKERINKYIDSVENKTEV
ncbi:MAG: hypothetical protein WC088_06250 [Candidatus Izemoplasmatales bacterium]|jgi:adenylate kinase family enzyme